MDIEIISVLLLAFGLGMLHALDADHIIAVSGLSSQTQNNKQDDLKLNDVGLHSKSSLFFCARWALGHGVALLVIGSAVMFLGTAIPTGLSAIAESLVGLVLIVIGALIFFDIYKQKAHLHFHQHNGSLRHAHWHHHQHDVSQHETKVPDDDSQHQHNHAPVFVGVLHGVAGSAPLLALLPLSTMSSPWTGITYLLLFGMGVFISMLIFGGVLERLFILMRAYGDKVIVTLRLLVSTVSISYGLLLVKELF